MTTTRRDPLAARTAQPAVLASDESAPVALKYDYDQLPAEHRDAIRDAATDIKRRERRAAMDIVEIGRSLKSVQDRLEHGEFLPWIETEFGWAKSMAYNFMAVADKFPKFGNLEQFGLSALYLLSGPSVPESVIDEANAIAAKGDRVTHKAAKSLIGATKPAPPRLLSEAEARAVILEVAYAAGSNPAQRCEWLENHHGLSHFTKTMTGAVNIDNRAFEAAYESAMLELSERTAPPSAAPAAVGKCRVCHRPLTDPASVGDACGPTCAAKLAAQGSADDAPALTKADIDRGGPTVCPHDLAAAGWALHETKRVGMSPGWSMYNYKTNAATEILDDPEYAIGQAYVKQRGFADAPASDAGRAKQFRIKGEIMHWREALRHLETVGELTGRHTLALPARRAIEDVIAAYEGMVVE